MDDDLREPVKDIEVFMPRVQMGIFYALLNLVSPVLIPLAYVFGNQFNNHTSLNGIFAFIAFLVVICFWSGSIVSCIWDMIRFGSHTSAFGLFLLIIMPVIWGIAIALFTWSKYQEYMQTISSLLT